MINHDDDLPERDAISLRLEQMTSESIRLTRRMLELAERDYGLVSGVTRVREGDMVGTFVAVVNYFAPGPPWIRVSLDAETEGGRQRGVNFYGAWEKIPSAEG
jgi:hypothetical protein